jgi:class 3 adenylate cyclase
VVVPARLCLPIEGLWADLYLPQRARDSILPEKKEREVMDKDSRQLAAIMLTDLVGYTALTQTDEALTLALLEEHAQLLRPLFTEHEGREVKGTGDGFLVEFPSALQRGVRGSSLAMTYSPTPSRSEIHTDS